MLDPEITDCFFRMRKREAIGCFRVCKTGRIEIHAHPVRLCPVDPPIEMLRFDFVTIDFFSAKLAIKCMEIEAVLTGNERECLVEV